MIYIIYTNKSFIIAKALSLPLTHTHKCTLLYAFSYMLKYLHSDKHKMIHLKQKQHRVISNAWI